MKWNSKKIIFSLGIFVLASFIFNFGVVVGQEADTNYLCQGEPYDGLTNNHEFVKDSIRVSPLVYGSSGSWVIDGWTTQFDFCTGDVLSEAACNGTNQYADDYYYSNVVWVNMTCSNGCNNGACTSSVTDSTGTSFSVGDSCSVVGDVDFSAELYCDLDSKWQTLKANSASCQNDFECEVQRCIEGICQDKELGLTQAEIDQANTALNDDDGFFCEWFGWGCPSLPPPPGCEDDDSCPEPPGGRSIDIFIYSPEDGLTYFSKSVPLRVKDKNKVARYWKYQLNDGPVVEFEPNITLTAKEGVNSLSVYALKARLSSSQEVARVRFIVNSQTTPRCGNDRCESGENSNNCPADCSTPPPASVCPNDMCEEDETFDSCPEDCENPEPPVNPLFIWLMIGLVLLILIILIIIIFILRKKHKKENGGNGNIIQNKPIMAAPVTRPLSRDLNKGMNHPLAVLKEPSKTLGLDTKKTESKSKTKTTTKKSTTVRPKSVSATKMPTRTLIAPAIVPRQRYKYVASRESKVYHFADSRLARLIKLQNRVYSNSEAELKSLGYKPAYHVKKSKNANVKKDSSTSDKSKKKDSKSASNTKKKTSKKGNKSSKKTKTKSLKKTSKGDYVYKGKRYLPRK